MEKSIKVSIILATYRRNYELMRALNSLTKLNYDNFEVILVDDNDESDWNSLVVSILDKFKVDNPNITVKYIANHPNVGSAKTRNNGIMAATGDYICFLDDDDIYLSDRISNQLIPMIEKNADYSITDLALYDDNDKFIESRKRKYIKDISKDSLLKYHFLYHMTGTDSLMFKRNYLMQIGMFDPIDVGDEFYLMAKAINQGGTFLYVPTCDTKAYIHKANEGISSGIMKITGEKRLYEYKKKFFHLFDKKTVCKIKMRHHAVLAFAYLTSKKYLPFIYEGLLAVICAPISGIALLFKKLGIYGDGI